MLRDEGGVPRFGHGASGGDGDVADGGGGAKPFVAIQATTRGPGRSPGRADLLPLASADVLDNGVNRSGHCGVLVKAIRQASLQEIENHLIRMGRGNHLDNMDRLSRFECHCSISLAEREFFELVFLQTVTTGKIAPAGEDRTLREVAKRAINLGQPKLSDNWDLSKNLHRMRERLAEGITFQKALVLRESNGEEEMWGQSYIQDGSHRALAFATLILLNEVQYEEQKAYCSMSQRTYQNLLSQTI